MTTPHFSRRDFLNLSKKTLVAGLVSGPLLNAFEKNNFAFSKTARAEGVIPDFSNLIFSENEARLVLKSSPEYSKLRSGFNLRTPHNPQGVVLAQTETSLLKSIEWAAKYSQPLHIRSGGHSYEGYSSGSGLVLDLKKMNQVNIDTRNQTVTVGSGARLGEVTQKLAALGYMLPTGSCPTVGVGGLVLGGGFGLSSRKYGLTIDQLISTRMIGVSGEVIEASLQENPELFWALRGGGGGQFGICTEFTFKIHPIRNVIVFSLKWPAEKARDVIKAWQEMLPTMPDEVTCLLNITGSAGSGLSDVKCVGQYIPKDPMTAPSRRILDQILSPLTSRVSPRFTSTYSERSFSDALRFFGGKEEYSVPVFFKAKSDMAYAPLSDRGIVELLNQLSHLPVGAVAALLDGYGGALSRVDNDATAFPHRKSLFSVQYYSQWGAASQTESRLQSLRKIKAAMQPYFSGKSYVNYIDSDVTGWQDAYYGPHYDRLLEVKRRYDPNNFWTTAAQHLKA